MAPIETHSAGATLPPLVDLNQERREERQGVFRRGRRHTGVILATVILALTVPLPLTFQALTLSREYQMVQRRAKDVRQRLQTVTADGDELDAKISRLTQLLQSQHQRHIWELAFPVLAACLPANVFLQQVQVSGQGKSAQVELQGSANTLAGIHAFAGALAQSSIFAHIHLDETTVTPSGVTFRMTGPLTAAPSGSTGQNTP